MKLLVAVSAAVMVLVLLVALVWIFQERIAFQPPRGSWQHPPDVRRVNYLASDGQELFAYLVDGSGSGKLLISFHGNADLSIWQIEWAEEVAARTGFTVMLPEYRGYMDIGGRPTYLGSQLDAEAAYRYARDTLGFSGQDIAFFGHSLGSAVATELAVKYPPSALLLQSPFTSAREMARRMTGYSPPPWLWSLMSRLHFQTEAHVKELDVPVSVAHGGKDLLIPPQMGRRIYDAAKHKEAWLLIPQASHNDVAVRGGDDYWTWIVKGVSGTAKK